MSSVKSLEERRDEVDIEVVERESGARIAAIYSVDGPGDEKKKKSEDRKNVGVSQFI